MSRLICGTLDVGTLQEGLLPGIDKTASIDLARRCPRDGLEVRQGRSLKLTNVPFALYLHHHGDDGDDDDDDTYTAHDFAMRAAKATSSRKPAKQRCKCTICVRKGGPNGCLVESTTKRSHENRMLNAAADGGSDDDDRDATSTPQISSRDAYPRSSTDAIGPAAVARGGRSTQDGLEAFATSMELDVPSADPAAAIDAGTREDIGESGREVGNNEMDLDLDLGNNE